MHVKLKCDILVGFAYVLISIDMENISVNLEENYILFRGPAVA